MNVIETLRQLFEDPRHEYDIKDRKRVCRQGHRFWMVVCKCCQKAIEVPIEQDLTKLPEYILNDCPAKHHSEAGKD